MAAKLHIFPLSTFCEKAVWALELAKVDVAHVEHFAGTHMRSLKRLSSQTSVPVLEIDSTTIVGSDKIAAFAAERVPRLVPPAHRDEILAWQDRLHREGERLRGVFFSDILDRPSLARDLFTAGQTAGRMTFYGVFFRLFCPMVRKMVRDAYPNPDASAQEVRQIFDDIHHAASDTGYLVGDQFTLADLTAAALSYPLIWPEQALGARYANTRREDLLAWHLRWKGHGIEDYVARIYRDHRHSAQTS